MAVLLVLLCILQCSLSTPITEPPIILSGKCVRVDVENYTMNISSLLREKVLPNLSTKCPKSGFCKTNPAASCKAIVEETPDATSGDYWISTCTGKVIQVYCDMSSRCCNASQAGWMRVANLDMKNPLQNCPAGLNMNSQPSDKRLCRRKLGTGCKSIFFPVNYMPYSRICGRVIAYQEGSADAFWQYYRDTTVTLDDDFIDGITISIGYPRTHVWSFAASNTEGGTGADSIYSCPCARTDIPTNGVVPPFVEGQYFCESGTEYNWASDSSHYHEDALWDGADCPENSSCCQLNNPPWFCRELETEVRNDFEVRLCGDEELANEDIGLEIIELYVQ